VFARGWECASVGFIALKNLSFAAAMSPRFPPYRPFSFRKRTSRIDGPLHREMFEKHYRTRKKYVLYSRWTLTALVELDVQYAGGRKHLPLISIRKAA